SSNLLPVFLRHRKARACGANVRPRSSRQLPARRRFAADCLRDFVKADAEYVVEKKGYALQRRETLERHHQWQLNVLRSIAIGIYDNRFGEPGPDISLTPLPRRFQLIKAKAGHDAPQIGLRLADAVLIDREPAEKRILDDVLGVRNGSEHS